MDVIILTRPSRNNRGEECPAGTVIAPDVAGWPEHRVQRHLQKGFARIAAREPGEPEAPDDAGRQTLDHKSADLKQQLGNLLSGRRRKRNASV